MGHSNIQTTARYIINCDPAHTNAVNAMAKMIMPIVEKARGKVEPDGIDERTSKAS